MVDLDELKRLAEGATPGPWIKGKFSTYVESVREWICQLWDKTEEDFPNAQANAAYIAAMNPDTAKKLIAVARAGLVAHREVQRFKMRWLNLPPFADKLNKTTRQAMTMAHQPIMQAEEALRKALEELK